MIYSRKLIPDPATLKTYHNFTHNILVDNDQTDISWFNDADHSQPYPFQIHTTSYKQPRLAGLRGTVDTDAYVQLDGYRPFFTKYSFHRHVDSSHSGPIPQIYITVWGVDSSGADSIELTALAADDTSEIPQYIYGIYIKQEIVDSVSTYSLHQTLTLPERSFFLWDISNSAGQFI